MQQAKAMLRPPVLKKHFEIKLLILTFTSAKLVIYAVTLLRDVFL